MANFTIDRPALLEINRKIVTMGGGDSHRDKESAFFVRRLSVFWGVLALRKIRSPTPKTKLVGRLGLDPLITVKHSPYGIANVLVLNGAKQHHRVTYDSKDCGGVFQVHTNEGIMEFKPSA